MIVSYEELRRIHRLEKTGNRLVEVDEDFFDSVNSFMVEEKKKYLEGLKELSSSRARDFSNLKKMVEEIFLLREKKLLNKALVSSRTGEFTEEKLSLQEKKTLSQLLDILSSHRSYLDSVFIEQPGLKEKRNDRVFIKVLKEIPSFVGIDMKEYGPFEKEQVIELPFRIANLLISRDLARQE